MEITAPVEVSITSPESIAAYSKSLDCVHCGLCLESCPTYHILGSEPDSPRGRIYLMRALEEERAKPTETLVNHLDLCLECKGCKGECPSNVDMAKLKYEFLAGHHERYGVPLRAKMFGHIERLNRIGSALAPVSNWVMGSSLSRWLLDRQWGLARGLWHPERDAQFGGVRTRARHSPASLSRLERPQYHRREELPQPEP
jgi:Fe-S oxidoreductase